MPMSSTVSSAKALLNRFFEWFGELSLFFWQVMRAAVTPPFEVRELVRQLDEIGSKSLPLVALAGAAIGAVLSFETRDSLVRFGAKSLLPAAVVFSIIHEIGPVITGLVVCGRAGAGIGAELGSMKVTEQIDAIEASAVNPYKLLAVTRILACILVLPLLTLAADFCGVIMAWVADAWLSRSPSSSSSITASEISASTIFCRQPSRPLCSASSSGWSRAFRECGRGEGPRASGVLRRARWSYLRSL